MSGDFILLNRDMEDLKQVFITGATGLIGSHLVVELLRAGGYSVHCSYRSEESLKKLQAVCTYFEVDYSRLQFHRVVLEDSDQLSDLFQKKSIEVVYHTAAIVEIDGSSQSEMISSNVELTSSVCRALEGLVESKEVACPLLVHVSSIAALGEKPYPELIDETTQIESIAEVSAYSQSKFLSENRVHRAVAMGVRAVIVSPSVVLGVLGDGSKMDGMQQIFSVLSNGMPIYTTGVMGFVDVRDVARVMYLLSLRAVEIGGERVIGQRYIISGKNLDFREFITTFNLAFGRRKPILGMGKTILSLVGWIAKGWSGLFGGKPLITPDTVAYMTSKSAYDGSKILAELPQFSYTDFQQSAKMVVDRLNFAKRQ